MAISNFVPEYWSTQLIIDFEANRVLNAITNRNWEGEIQGSGDTVRIQTPVAIPVAARAGNVTYTTPTSITQSLVIDQDYEWAFLLEDLEKIQSNVDLTRIYTSEGGKSMAQRVDQDIAGLYVDAAAGTIPVTLASDNVYEKIVDAGKVLDDGNVPSDGRVLFVSSAFKAALLKHANFIHATTAGDNVLRNGMIGQIAGFDVFMSNNLTLATTRKCLFGHPSAITWAGQMAGTEALRDKDTWHDYIRSRLVWGRKVVRPTALGVLDVTE